MADLIGYQRRIEWMGVEVRTLAGAWPAGPRAVVVGINPSLDMLEHRAGELSRPMRLVGMSAWSATLR